jgi:hypothetical protein
VKRKKQGVAKTKIVRFSSNNVHYANVALKRPHKFHEISITSQLLKRFFFAYELPKIWALAETLLDGDGLTVEKNTEISCRLTKLL